MGKDARPLSRAKGDAMRARAVFGLGGLLTATIAAGVAYVVFNGPSDPQLTAQETQGHELVKFFCARCHAVETTGASPLPAAPPFRILHERYDVSFLDEALVEGIVTSHPDMPEFTFEPDEADAIIAWLKALER